MSNLKMWQSPAGEPHIVRHDAQAFGLNFSNLRPSERAGIGSDQRVCQPIRVRRKAQAIAVTVGANQQHRAADGVERNQLRSISEVIKMEATLIAPGIEVEGLASPFSNAVGLNNVALVTEQLLDDVWRELDNVCI